MPPATFEATTRDGLEPQALFFPVANQLWLLTPGNAGPFVPAGAALASRPKGGHAAGKRGAVGHGRSWCRARNGFRTTPQQVL